MTYDEVDDASEAEDRLLDLELRALGGARAAAPQQEEMPSPSRFNRQSWLWAAAVLAGVGVLIGVSQLAEGTSDAGATPTAGAPAGAGTGAAAVTQDPAPDPVPREPRWTPGDPVPAEAATLESLVIAHGPEAVSPASTVLELVRKVPRLQRLRLESVGPAATEEECAAMLQSLAVMPGLRQLELHGEQWLGCLPHLGDLSGLSSLDLIWVALWPADLQVIAELTGLRHLGLGGGRGLVAGDIRKLIARLPNLASVRLLGTPIDNELIEAVVGASNIVAVDWLAPYKHEDDVFAPLFAETRWRRLILRYRGTISPEQLQQLGVMESLRTVGFGNGSSMQAQWQKPEGLFTTLAKLPELDALDFQYAYGIRAEEFGAFAGKRIRRVVTFPGTEGPVVAKRNLQGWFPDAEVEILEVPVQTMDVEGGADREARLRMMRALEEAKAAMEKAQAERLKREQGKKK